MNSKIKTICCIGAGYVGGPTMAVIAEKCPEIEVNVVDIDKDRINKWNDANLSKLPIFEPGLSSIVKKTRDKNLHFSTDIEKNISSADIIFISVNTPTKKSGIGAGLASDLKWIESCARQVANFASGHTIIVEKSTIPVKTAEVIKEILLNTSKKKNTKSGESSPTFDILSNPEFLAEGCAIKNLINPDRILIGGENQNSIQTLSEIYKNWIPKEKIITTNLWSSELAKLTSNAFLAQRISSINSISTLCEITGANVEEVANAIGADKRIGPNFIKSGPGFGGSCFKKDILNLVYLSKFYGLNEIAEYWEQVVKLNDWHKKRITGVIVKKLFGTLSGKRITILGFAFKANTNDTRESPAIQICKDLVEENAFLSIYDPKVNPKQIEKDLELPQIKNKITSDEIYKGWTSTNDIYESLINAHAVVILTEWEEFSYINWNIASEKMIKPGWVFDTRTISDSEKIIDSGLKLWTLGNGTKRN